jgi:hypothetical protein
MNINNCTFANALCLVSFCFILFIIGGCANHSTGIRERISWSYEQDAVGWYCHSSLEKTPLCKLKPYPPGWAGLMGSTTYVYKRIELQVFHLNRVVINAIENSNFSSSHNKSNSNFGFGILSCDSEKIVTEWREILGKESGILWWKRRYISEAKHTITISRSNENHNCSNINISTEVRERPNENHEWTIGDAELGRESFTNLKMVLLTAIEKSLRNTRG